MNVAIAFLTGLTAGGLGCVAVQGGLLATSLALQVDRDLEARGGGAEPPGRSASPFRFAQPITLFLFAKVVAYTVLGFLLGACGSYLQITPLTRAVLMIVIGLFMLGNGLRLLSVHPVFRGFVIEPPAAIGRFIRRTSRRGTLVVTPLFLGSLTVLLPCGVTQAVMAAALATGSPLEGASLLLAFTLGTLPLFFVVAFSTMRLGATLQVQFRRIVAVILMAFGAGSCVLGFNLAGVPVALVFRSRDAAGAPKMAAYGVGTPRSYPIRVSAEGYDPPVLHLPAGRPVTLVWITRGVTCCAASVAIPGLSRQLLLPATGETPLRIEAQRMNTVLNYSCSAGRRVGQLIFDGE